MIHNMISIICTTYVCIHRSNIHSYIVTIYDNGDNTHNNDDNTNNNNNITLLLYLMYYEQV